MPPDGAPPGAVDAAGMAVGGGAAPAAGGVAAGAHPLFMSCVDLMLLNEVQSGFVTSIRMLSQDPATATMSLEQLKEAVAELFPPHALFCHELMSLPYLHRDLQNWLDQRGASLQAHSFRRIAMTLPTRMCEEAHDETDAAERIRFYDASQRRPLVVPAQLTPRADGPAPQTPPSNRAAHDVPVRFRDNSHKFSGGIGESWIEYVADYLQVARDYNLTPTQKFIFLHNLLCGDAKRFYMDSVEIYAINFGQAVELVKDE